MNTFDYSNWSPLSLSELSELLKGLNASWWLAGGYALELFVGYSYRAHEDIDILIKREQQLIVQEYLAHWELFKGTRPGLAPWEKGEYLEVGTHDVWCRPNKNAPWKLQIMLFDTSEEEWIYRRDPRIKGKLTDFGKISSDGIAYLSPEIQLLYKAKNIRPKDQLDFEKVWPLLDEQAKNWLQAKLKDQYPKGHDWLVS